MAETNSKFPLALRKSGIELSDEKIAAIINRQWEQKGEPLYQNLVKTAQELQEARNPSGIIQRLQQLQGMGRQYTDIYKELALVLDGEIEKAIEQKKGEIKAPLSKLSANLSEATSKESSHSKMGMGGGLAAMFGVIFAIPTGGASLVVAAAGAAVVAANQPKAVAYEEEMNDLGHEIGKLNDSLEAIKQYKVSLPKQLNTHQIAVAFVPQIMAHRYGHAKGIHEELNKSAARHGVAVDTLAEYLQKNSPETANSLAALLKADYRQSDLTTLSEYAAKADITASPAQRAFLQFINHAILPHQDYFEIWASKMHDLERAQQNIIREFLANTPEKRPALELLREKPVSLSGKIPSTSEASTFPTPGTLEEKRAEKEVLATAAQSADFVYGIQAVLTDESKGLRERHQAVCEKAIGHLQQFNTFFSGIGAKLAELDRQLDHMIPNRDRMEVKWDRAKSNAMQLELLKVRDPAHRHMHNSKVNWAATAAENALDYIFEPIKSTKELAKKGVRALARVGANEVRNVGTRIREDMEYAIQIASMEERHRIKPAELAKLKTHLDELDKEVDELSKNKEFLAFLAKNPALEDIRTTYMLLPRLIAGEANIDALEFRARREGYAQIDGFVGDLRKDSPRLADAMQNFLLGFANTNDLKVLVAEGNAIANPRTHKERVLVGYVEDVIKEHYSDQARQASIVDLLEMRNVIVTGRSFHSFGEIVKRETDVALQALLSGKGNFSLVGSNDVHQIFGYYRARHGEDYFADLHEREKRVVKRAHITDPDEVRTKRKDTGRTRNADTRVPRVSSIFTEICAHEYLLSQKFNIVKDARLSTVPHALGALEMVNTVAQDFMQRLALETARKHKQAGDHKKPAAIGHLVESLIAETFVDFFSELGALHGQDPQITEHVRKLKRAFSGENFSLTNSNYNEVITESAHGSFGLFLDIYHRNLENWLEVASRENRQILLEQLSEVQGMMKDIQPTDKLAMPGSEAARLKAHYRNHSLSNAGANHATWTLRAEAIHKGSKEIN